jgi:DNA-binding NarL/FixJ family response regulator
MENQGNIGVLVIEKDQTVVESIELVLKEKSYIVASSSNEDEALGLLRETPCPLAIVGDTKGTSSTFEIMRKIVMTSPMTSIILISDLPKEEVDEKAEGYGILGHVSRSIPSKDLVLLIEQFEKISQSIHSPKA